MLIAAFYTVISTCGVLNSEQSHLTPPCQIPPPYHRGLVASWMVEEEERGDAQS
ncbi:hypothetical protein [Chlorogloeopsis sp. ULAP02]|uniref:hypothetical protein n=1 Tax=Chlorogloeopsis sp. ULAP02 TaxID=3107926 RepID=UPI003136A354